MNNEQLEQLVRERFIRQSLYGVHPPAASHIGAIREFHKHLLLRMKKPALKLVRRE